MPDSDRSKRTEKLQLMLDDQELRAIDDWRFEHRMPTRAAAIRELLRRGLLTRGFDEAGPDQASTDYRVVEDEARPVKPATGEG
jgi:hypothetical protein